MAENQSGTAASAGVRFVETPLDSIVNRKSLDVLGFPTRDFAVFAPGFRTQLVVVRNACEVAMASATPADMQPLAGLPRLRTPALPRDAATCVGGDGFPADSMRRYLWQEQEAARNGHEIRWQP